MYYRHVSPQTMTYTIHSLTYFSKEAFFLSISSGDGSLHLAWLSNQLRLTSGVGVEAIVLAAKLKLLFTLMKYTFEGECCRCMHNHHSVEMYLVKYISANKSETGSVGIVNNV